MRIDFNIVYLTVDQLFGRALDRKDQFGIKKQNDQITIAEPELLDAECDFIREFIESCGWTIDEYIDRSFAPFSSKSMN